MRRNIVVMRVVIRATLRDRYRGESVIYIQFELIIKIKTNYTYTLYFFVLNCYVLNYYLIRN